MPAVRKSSIVKIPKAGELVAGDLRRRIITGALKTGDPLPNESELMEEFGVSRPTLREAFRILESESIITVLRGARGGARVLEPDGSVAARYTGLLLQYQGTPLLDVYRARTELEVSAVGMIGARRRKSSLADLEEMIREGGALVDDEAAFAEYSVGFHLCVVDSTGNTTLGVLANILFQIIEAHNAIFIASHPRGYELTANRNAQRAYVKLVKLLREGDTDGAQRHWRRHLEAVEKFMVGDVDTTLVEVLS